MKSILSIIISLTTSFAQQTPLEKNNFTKLTTYDELTNYVKELDKFSDMINVEVLGKSVEKRNLYVMKFYNSAFGKTYIKLRI
jgi:hypothetical protein